MQTHSLLRNTASASSSVSSCSGSCTWSSGWWDHEQRGLELLTRCVAKGTGRCGQPGDQTLKDMAGAEDSGGRAKNLCTWTVRV